MNEWMTLVQTFGVTVVLVGAQLVAVWRVSPWIGENVIMPVVGKYLTLLDSLIVSITKQGDAMERISRAMDRIAVNLNDIKCRSHDPDEGDASGKDLGDRGR